MRKRIYYLAGPMTRVAQFNFPAFIKAAAALRDNGYEIMSPAELDAEEDDDMFEKAMRSPDGNLEILAITQTWGDMLARDVKLITDEVEGIVFLSGWEKSKGARLEAFVGLLTGKDFKRYVTETGGTEAMTKQSVLSQLVRTTHAEIRDV